MANILRVCHVPGCRGVARFVKTWKDRPPHEREYYCEEHGMSEANASWRKGKRTNVYLTPLEGSWEKYLEHESKHYKRAE